MHNHVLDSDWGYAGAPPQSGQHWVILTHALNNKMDTELILLSWGFIGTLMEWGSDHRNILI